MDKCNISITVEHLPALQRSYHTMFKGRPPSHSVFCDDVLIVYTTQHYLGREFHLALLKVIKWQI